MLKLPAEILEECLIWDAAHRLKLVNDDVQNGKKVDNPTSKETGINIKKRPLNSPAESTLEPKTAKTSQSQLPVKQRKNNHQ